MTTMGVVVMTESAIIFFFPGIPINHMHAAVFRTFQFYMYKAISNQYEYTEGFMVITRVISFL